MKGFKKNGKFRPTENKKSLVSSKTLRRKETVGVKHVNNILRTKQSLILKNDNKNSKLESPFNKELKIKPTAFYGRQEGHKHIPMTPKDFLDVTSSTGLEERIDMHNSGIISDLGGVHTEDPDSIYSFSRNYTDGGDAEHNANFSNVWIDGEAYQVPKKYFRLWKGDGSGTEFHPDWEKHRHHKNDVDDEGIYWQGINEDDYIDEDTAFIEENRINKVLGTGEDTRKRSNSKDRNNVYDVDGNLLRPKQFDRQHEIFRGDELGTIEYLKRNIRHGKPMEVPFLDTNGREIKQHEGRHRSRALFEEGVEEIPVNFFEENVTDPKYLKPQTNSLREKYPFGKKENPDIRNPIMGVK